MKHLKVTGIALLSMLTSFAAYAESSYDIAELYSVIKPASGTKAVGKYDKVIDAEYILTPTKMDSC
ncbi:MAG: hypothetical protein K2L80_01520 [Muribaculaceae bacterium]|nr:hypothetical protein [Muribaculaceae bacterium]